MRARKRFGQNFLTDPGVIDRIIHAISPRADQRILEIGPGHGALTESLIRTNCDLTTVEIDRDLSQALQSKHPRLRIIEEDVLKVDLPALLSPLTRVVGNLPYNISTPLLFRLFKHTDLIQDMHFMLQLEVVNRMAAGPSEPDYGRLSIMTRYYCDAEKLFDVPSGAFTPSPKVTSAVVRLTPTRRTNYAADIGTLELLVTRAFSQRRKTIRNSFKGLLTAGQLVALDVDPTLRPENLDLETYIRCANAIAEATS